MSVLQINQDQKKRYQINQIIPFAKYRL